MSLLTRSHSLRTYLPTISFWGIFLLGAVGISAAIVVGEVRLAVTAVIFSVLFSLSMIDIRLSILGLFGFLTVLGDLRRLLVPIVGWSGSDPILMVAPVFTILLLGFALTTNRLSTSSGLSKCMVLFTGIMLLQIFNPKQGGLPVGIAGALLVIVPTFWFWIGQAYGSETFLKRLFFAVLLPLSGLALIMGFVQLSYGYLPYQLDWYRIAGYSALGDSEATLRPLSIFPNITEYLIYIAIAAVILAGSLLHEQGSSRVKQVAVFLLPACLAALLLSGSRGPLVMTILTIVLMWAIKGQSVASWVPRLAIAALLGTMGFVWSLNQASEFGGSKRVQANLQRQADLIETGGTASIHADLAWSALYHGTFKEPLGSGIGSITLAASKYGGQGFNSEKDITNMFIATGVVGGVVYLVLVGIIAVKAVRFWLQTRRLIALLIFGILAVTGLAWLHSGHYVTTPLVWLIIGTLDRISSNAAPPNSS